MIPVVYSFVVVAVRTATVISSAEKKEPDQRRNDGTAGAFNVMVETSISRFLTGLFLFPNKTKRGPVGVRARILRRDRQSC